MKQHLLATRVAFVSISASLLGLLSVDNTVPDNTLAEVFGITPTPFAPDELQYLKRITASSALSSLFERR